ncbi:hypothetical protein AGABI1DRAFT_133383 [Agaricus bisporus var. burnettii JB137-S8]|uniref:Uncharacterized protein n=1 Tax=Agaricus bisporus var. burnettii (strain JB137-S8 / ATCC MYA-4627 / FGSC 10392) TaxID=597362 RepID=K5WGD7_AGABU|nr:uncharacterized protein AGABI1DRAFT_133383 [Agaricus bisporus var. burnettii JB137-S8]EKM74336.1 hypothetical protein AGABI1DRAFT_133383 [Agaricus bisporus var. burnettii JB137-S8]
MVFSDHVFTPGDYEFWKQRSQSILDSKRGRAAVLHGGYVWRLALAAGHGVSEALKGPSGLHPRDYLNFCAWDKDGVEYVDDDLTKDELDLMCGVYQSFTGTGTNIKKQSWYPLVSTFEGSGEDQGRWYYRLEQNYKNRESSILGEKVTVNSRLLLSATQWRDKVRGFGEARRATASVEKWSTRFIDTYCPL